MSNYEIPQLEKDRRREQRARPEFYIALAVSFLSWGYKVISQKPNVYFGWALNTVAFVLFAKAFWDYCDFQTWLKGLIVTLFSVVFIAVAIHLIREALRPSFTFLVSGVVLNGDTWLFIVNQRGPETLYNVEFLFIDEDKAPEFRKRSSITASDIASEQQILPFPEVNPKGRGSIFAKQFLWKPVSFEHEHFSVEVTSRKAGFHEDMRIESFSERWLYAIIVKDAEKDKTLLACSDEDFPSASLPREKLPKCFPDITQP